MFGADPFLLADRTGSRFLRLKNDQGEFHLDLWRRPVFLTYPDFHASQGEERETLSAFNTALLLYYFNTADGAPLGGDWISFTELPDGRFYTQAFQSYSGDALARTFRNDPAAFQRAAENLGGIKREISDLSFEFQALPRVPLLVACWQGDEEFPTSFKVLFDSSAPHYLPTDGYAILGSHITRRLISTSSMTG